MEGRRGLERFLFILKRYLVGVLRVPLLVASAIEEDVLGAVATVFEALVPLTLSRRTAVAGTVRFHTRRTLF